MVRGIVAAWLQIAAILLMAPAAFYGGSVRAKQLKRRSK